MLGFGTLLVCLIPVTTVEEVINTSFTVSPSKKYGPYDIGTVYHTRINIPILSKSVLKGEVIVEGEGIHLTINGYIPKPIRDSHIRERYTFIIDPADDLYTFVFDNTRGNNESFVEFTLEEIWTRPIAMSSPPLFIAGILGFFLFLVGLITLAMSHFLKKE